MFVLSSRTINLQIYITKNDVRQKKQEVKFADICLAFLRDCSDEE